MSYTNVLLRGNIRIYLSDLTSSAQSALNKQQTKPLSGLTLATAVSIFVPLAALKRTGEISVLMRASGPIKNIVVEASSRGTFRALVGNPFIITEHDRKNYNDIPLQLALGDSGILRINHMYGQENFSGEVELVKRDLVTDLAYYFAQSEQIFTAVVASVKLATPKRLAQAYSAIFQLLPGHTEADAVWIETFVREHKIGNESLVAYEAALKAQLVEKYLWRWKCSCSNSKARGILGALSQHEQEELIKVQGMMEVVCSFCKKKYQFKTVLDHKTH